MFDPGRRAYAAAMDVRGLLAGVAVVVAVATAGCTGGGQAPAPTDTGGPAAVASTSEDVPAPTTPPPTPRQSPAATTSSTPAPTPSSEAATPATPPSDPLAASGPGPLGVSVTLPDDPAGATTVVTVHGGAWLAGSPASMQPLGADLVDRGMVVANLSYRTVLLDGTFPGIVDDVACGIRYAKAVAAAVGASGRVVVVGHSAGAHLAAVASLAPDRFGGQDCPWPGDAQPSQLVGLAGVYDIDSVEPVMRVLLGGDRSQQPAAWDAFDPAVQLATPTAGVGEFPVLLLVGSDDTLAPPRVTQQFATALWDAGVEAVVQELPDVDHFTIIDADVGAFLAPLVDR